MNISVCTIDHLRSVFDEETAQQLYDGYELKEKVCSDIGTTIQLQGKYNTNAETMKGLNILILP